MKKQRLIFIFISFVILLVFVVSLILLYSSYSNEVKNNSDSSSLTDSTPPTPTIYEGPLKILNKINTELTVYGNICSMFIQANKPIKLSNDSYFARLINIGKNKYVLELFQLIEGANELEISLIDDQGNKENLKFLVQRKPGSPIKDWEGFKYTDETKDLLILVDKQNKITTSYEPNDLVDIGATPYSLYVNVKGLKLRKEAADALKKMLDDYYKEYKEHLVISSAYRSYNDQYQLHNYWVSELGLKEAEKVSAKPGYSEHQLGTVVDFINKDSSYLLSEKFAETKSYTWLLANAHNYGFVLSYPKDKEEITGYKFEPWHWRYIGIENAKEFNSQKEMALNQWLAVKNNKSD